MTITLNEIDAGIVQGALDTLGSALADHDHVWSEGEKTIFESATILLGTESCCSFKPDKDGEEWREQA
jgi:hypothetical protein